ncbi:bi-domain-containing oxidoreductase [Paenibacillus sp.]|jgi:predicted dehydrogenase/threonine dehydrogenase-like Zn-dependent dehydrogenase|uniref:bi-domain-containing oxidoreductase n=1 Tax=Paenibacillus sp. TaxID=58172 RepID=UPI002819E46F|nr:bi-domain-containing oxidoreductase [Paenibacillus sp.]MDR0268460.1 bi-domain-containing oxidoreductase [Paenibacillus sp.]
MNQVIIRHGNAVVEQTPAPEIQKGTVLVQVEHSCISIGTEISGLRTSGVPLWKRAVQQPDKVKKLMQIAATQGLSHTRNMLKLKTSSGQPSGYSAAGMVIEVGEGVVDLKVGDRVACAGAQFAHHAEIIRVPRNLVTSVPEGLGMAEASTVTLGAIAMQGLRRAAPTLGETFVVIGLGILGQLTAQLLKANGCRVIGTDLDDTRIALAQRLGMDMAIQPGEESGVEAALRLTDGLGADGVIITAAARSSVILSEAFRMTRKKGRVVVVGDVGLEINRADIYEKELDFYISTSYGPGRYDRDYEEKGRDYPLGYVRWTENRNMREYLRLASEGKIQLGPMISCVFPVDQAAEAYTYIQNAETKPMMVLLSYPQTASATGDIHKVTVNPGQNAVQGADGKVRIGLIGAGEFAKGMHLPNINALSGMFQLQAVMSQTGHNAAETAKQFGAVYASTSYPVLLQDPEIDAVLIATRHDTHASIVLDALHAGKHVFVEKPLALTRTELENIEKYYADFPDGRPAPVLVTGFNRRFSPYATKIKEMVEQRSNPMILNYRMNAGYLPLDHWTQTEEGGGRNRGECCHIYDLITYLTGSRVQRIHASHIRPGTKHYTHTDNFVATMEFADGSVATVTYTALGSKSYPKEQMDIYVDGKNIFLDDYRRLLIAGSKLKGMETKIANKGQRETLEQFGEAARGQKDWPIPLWQQIQAMEIALEVERLLTKGMMNS